MSASARIKNLGGGNTLPAGQTLASAGTIDLGDAQTYVLLTSAGAYSTATTKVFINGSAIRPGRTVVLYNGNTSDDITIKATATASALENYVSGSADTTLTAGKAKMFFQLTNGAWAEII
jgi:hypothetical protein